MKDLSSIVAKFKVQGTVEEIKPLGAGLINDTYKVNTKETDAPDYVLQRINHAIFQNVEMLQSNIAAVTGGIVLLICAAALALYLAAAVLLVLAVR